MDNVQDQNGHFSRDGTYKKPNGNTRNEEHNEERQRIPLTSSTVHDTKVRIRELEDRLAQVQLAPQRKKREWNRRNKNTKEGRRHHNTPKNIMFKLLGG